MAIEMDAFDPETGDTTRVRVASGTLLVGRCRRCGCENGAHIDAPEHPAPPRPDYPCLECADGGDMEYVRAGEI